MLEHSILVYYPVLVLARPVFPRFTVCQVLARFTVCQVLARLTVCQVLARFTVTM